MRIHRKIRRNETYQRGWLQLGCSSGNKTKKFEKGWKDGGMRKKTLFPKQRGGSM